jgi:hypothetical protein
MKLESLGLLLTSFLHLRTTSDALTSWYVLLLPFAHCYVDYMYYVQHFFALLLLQGGLSTNSFADSASTARTSTVQMLLQFSFTRLCKCDNCAVNEVYVCVTAARG